MAKQNKINISPRTLIIGVSLRHKLCMQKPQV